MLDVLATKLLEYAAGAAIGVVQDAIKRENAELLAKKKLAFPQPEFVAASHLSAASLQSHIEMIQSWCSTISFSDLRSRKSILSIYVELDTFLMPMSTHASRDERKSTRPLLSALANSNEHSVILGQPGAGKTTSIQKVCADFFVSGKALLNYNFPILIRLRELSNSNSDHPVIDKLQQIFALDIKFPKRGPDELAPSLRESIRRQAVISYVEKLSALLLLDGFDEIADSSAQSAAIRDIEGLFLGLKGSKILLTSRNRELRYKLGNIRKFEIAPLTRDQVATFALRWLQSNNRAEDLLQKIYASPFADTAMRPLTIAHLCAIYERLGSIPEKPKSVYRKVVNLLLEEWDSQRSIVRLSRYGGFDQDRKFEFIAHVAYVLTAEIEKLVFDDQALKEVYDLIHKTYGLPMAQAELVIGEIESHSGLIIEGGYRQYEFAHKSLQEFLAADYIVRLPETNLISRKVKLLANELAIATALSSRPATYFSNLYYNIILPNQLPPDWHGAFLTRLALEKPDFGGNPSLEAALAALYMVTAMDNPGAYVELFGALMPMNLERMLGAQYKLENVSNEYKFFKLVNPDPRREALNRLRVPIQFVR